MPLRALTLNLTSRCNLVCRYCYQDVRRSGPTGRMSDEVMLAALGALLAGDEPGLQVTFTGGEPLLEFPRLRRAVAYLQRRARPDQHIRLSLLTNGTLLTPAMVDFLAGHRVEIQLSLDGVVAAQNQRGQGTFATLAAVLDMLQERQPNFMRQYLTVAMTVLPATLSHLADSFSYLLTRKVRRLILMPVLTTSPGWWPGRIEELDRQFRRICEQSLQHHEETGDIPLLAFRPGSRETDCQADTTEACSALDRSSPTVDVDGQLYGCGIFAASTFPVSGGLLHDLQQACRQGVPGADLPVGSQARLTAPAPAVQVLLSREGRYSAYGKCADCVYAARCHVCPLAIGSWNGDQDPQRVPDFICAFNYSVQKYREWFLRRASKLRTLLNSDLLREQMRPWLERAAGIE